MKTITSAAVIGLGNWGTALANHLATKGIRTTGWTLDQKVVHDINTTHHNSRYLQNAPLHRTLRATARLDDIADCEALVLAIPAAAMSEVFPTLKPSPNTVVVSAIKGFEDRTLFTPLQLAESIWGDTPHYAVLSGPSFAKDIVAGLPASVVTASKDGAIAHEVAQLFSSPLFRSYPSTDPLGVELGGALKNVIALAVGICDGLGLGDSARAAVITRGLYEITKLAVAMGAQATTLSGLSGLGDLVMTATCDTSRNRSAGLKLGQGMTATQVLKEATSVIEGIHTVPLVMKLAEQFKIELPISATVYELLQGKIEAREVAGKLLSRPTKGE